jgi:hypothetical protein
MGPTTRPAAREQAGVVAGPSPRLASVRCWPADIAVRYEPHTRRDAPLCGASALPPLIGRSAGMRPNQLCLVRLTDHRHDPSAAVRAPAAIHMSRGGLGEGRSGSMCSAPTAVRSSLVRAVPDAAQVRLAEHLELVRSRG